MTEPVTDAGYRIDPITLAVLAGRLEQIMDQRDATMLRAAFNPIIAEAHDASHGPYRAASGDTLVQGKCGKRALPDVDPAARAIDAEVGSQLGLSSTRAAEAILTGCDLPQGGCDKAGFQSNVAPSPGLSPSYPSAVAAYSIPARCCTRSASGRPSRRAFAA